MRCWVATSAVFLCCVLALPSTSSAQSPARGEIAAAFDEAGTVAARTVGSFETFQIYLVATGVGEIRGWEGSLYTPPVVAILQSEFSEPGALNSASPGNYLVGLGVCANYVEPTALVRIEALLMSDDPAPEVRLCIGPSSPHSVDPPAPAFVDCANNAFAMRLANAGGDDYPDGCAVVNPTMEPPIAAERQSFGGWKSAAGHQGL